MRSAIKINTRPRLARLTHVMRIKGVDVYIHWSVLLIAAIMLLNTIRRPILTLVGGLAYLSVLLIHECGHVIAAHRRRCHVDAIELYPIHGYTRFETPWSRFDHCVIAWGGVLTQAAIGIPLVLWVALFGYTPFEPVNAILAILGFFNLAVAAFNLIPSAPLDGAIAWELIPALVKRARERRTKELPRYKSPR